MTVFRKLDNRREVELAEGVHIHLSPAGLFPRLLARLIDVLIWGGCYILFLFGASLLGTFLGGEAQQGLVLLLSFMMAWFYDPLFEASKFAGTPGKLILGLKVIRRSGAAVGFGSGFLRVLLFWIDFLPGLGTVGIISILVSKNSQRLGDLVADTLVVYRVPSTGPEPDEVSVPAVRPGLLLPREEELAFIEFADRYKGLSPARQSEVTEPLLELEAARRSPNTIQFALGVSRWLSQKEK